jgi:hypothetical protein
MLQIFYIIELIVVKLRMQSCAEVNLCWDKAQCSDMTEIKLKLLNHVEM